MGPRSMAQCAAVNREAHGAVMHCSRRRRGDSHRDSQQLATAHRGRAV